MATLGVIRLQLIEAEFNHENDVFTKMDPYCKITCENKHWKSSICQDGGKVPKWKDQYFEFQVNSKDSVILFQFIDEDIAADDQIGDSRSKISALITSQTNDVWLPVQHSGKPAGKVHLKCQWTPNPAIQSQQTNQSTQQIQKPQPDSQPTQLNLQPENIINQSKALATVAFNEKNNTLAETQQPQVQASFHNEEPKIQQKPLIKPSANYEESQSQQQVQQNFLTYRIVNCTSQDSYHLVNELSAPEVDHEPGLSGWQSQRFCIYPQEIIVSFPQPVKLSKIQFLVHEYLIPQTIHLFSVIPPQHQTEEICQPLGYFQLDSSKQSNYRTREFKTVYLDVICQHFKVSCGKNFQNNLNKFNQVGLFKLKFQGSVLNDHKIINTQQQSVIATRPQIAQDMKPRNMKIQSVLESEFEPEIINKIRLINLKKEQAVRQENFDIAMDLKTICDKLKMIGQSLVTMEQNKNKAIEREDFNHARELKLEIEAMRKALLQIDPLDPFNEGLPKTFDQSLNMRDLSHDVLAQNSDQNYTQNQDYFEEEQTYSPTRNQKNHDDQTLPALVNKKLIDYNLVNEDVDGGIGGSDKPDQSESLEYKDIAPTMKLIADSILPYYGELCCVKMFHRRWQFREEGVKYFITEMPKVFEQVDKNDLLTLNSAVLTVLAEVLKDKVQQIITKSFDAVEQYQKQMILYPQLTVRADTTAFEKLLVYILDRQTDSRLFHKTLKVYLMFYSVKQVDGGYLTAFLMKQSSYLNKQNYGQTLHQAIRLRMLNEIILAKKVSKEIPTDTVYPAIRACINASVAEQRKAAHDLTITLYKTLGWKNIESLVQQGFSQKTLVSLKTEIPEVTLFIKQ